jgi:hypothetical protein
VEVTGPSGTIGTTVGTETVLMTHTFNTVAGRRYRIEAFTQPQSTVAGDKVFFRLLADGVLVQSCAKIVGATYDGFTISRAWNAPATGTVTLELTAYRLSGTGNCSIFASAAQKSYLTAYDVGSSV